MKIAVSGKGGVGKSTVAAALAILASREGGRVLALDADPDANLASALGIPHAEQTGIVPISRQIELIEERTGAKVSQYGQVFKMNPDVADVAERFGTPRGGVSLLVLGAVNKGGSGCACPENTFIKALVTDMVLYKKDTLVMDMEAGIEHLGRATTRGVDLMIAVAEPGQRAADCVANVTRMAADIGLTRVAAVGNKIRGPEDEAFLRAALPDLEFLAMIPYTEALRAADRDGMSVMDAAAADPALAREFASLYEKVRAMADRREGKA